MNLHTHHSFHRVLEWGDVTGILSHCYAIEGHVQHDVRSWKSETKARFELAFHEWKFRNWWVRKFGLGIQRRGCGAITPGLGMKKKPQRNMLWLAFSWFSLIRRSLQTSSLIHFLRNCHIFMSNTRSCFVLNLFENDFFFSQRSARDKFVQESMLIKPLSACEILKKVYMEKPFLPILRL